MPINSIYASLDIGEARIGVAMNSGGLRIAQPRGVIKNDTNVIKTIDKLVKQEHIEKLIIGLPRGLQSQETNQTKYVREFVKRLQKDITIPIIFQDEALTSIKAEKELQLRGKPYDKADVDALAACYILEDFLHTLPWGNNE